MAFNPSEIDLGTVLENTNFSHTITYFTEEEPIEEANVVIVALENNPSSITISGNTLSGYYFDSFDNTITYRTPSGTFPVVQKFEQINRDELYQMISYKASSVRTKVFTYRADAIIDDEIVASQVYTKTVQNDWTNGKNSLQTFVGYTE
jgi:hypothetical protein